MSCLLYVWFVCVLYVCSVPVLWYCWLGLLTCKTRLPYNLYCVGVDVKHSTATIIAISGQLLEEICTLVGCNVLLLWLTCCCITNLVCYRLLVVTWPLFCDSWIVACPVLCSWVFVSALHKTRLWCILCVTGAQLDMVLFIIQLSRYLRA